LPNVPEAQKSFLTCPMELLGEWVMWNLISVHLEIMLVSRQHRCMVCTEHTIGSVIVLDAPIGTTRRQGSGGSSFWSVWR
jgi:hypothetical protein